MIPENILAVNVIRSFETPFINFVMQSQNQRGYVRHGIAGEITYYVLLILSIKL
jgi:hypothetical protein